MPSRMKYLILVLWITQSVNATSQPHNAYCSKHKGEEKNVFFGGSLEIFCIHQEIQKGDQFRRENQTKFNAGIYFVELIYVTGDLHKTSLDLFPDVQFILILKSNITEFSLKSDTWHLDVTNSVFPKVTSERLKGCREVITLGFRSNPGLEFEAGAFRHLTGLRGLVLINQTIPRLQKSFLEGLNRLDTLVLNLNDLSVVDEDAFVDRLNLEQINLDDNPIEYFKANISGLARLKALSLMKTKLKVISINVNVNRNHFYHLHLPTPYLLNTNSSALLAIVPKLHYIGIIPKDFECPTVKPVLEQLKRDGFKVTKVSEYYDLEEVTTFSILSRMRYDVRSNQK